MVRQISTHVVPGDICNEQITILAKGLPNTGGAHTVYTINDKVIEFQVGNPADGVNGITNEALLAIVIDRLQGFVNGPFHSIDTHVALANCKRAMECLHHRTRDRIENGKLGKQEP
jgi:hypothetical protein